MVNVVVVAAAFANATLSDAPAVQPVKYSPAAVALAVTVTVCVAFAFVAATPPTVAVPSVMVISWE